MKKIIALGLAVVSCLSIASAGFSTCEIGFTFDGKQQPIEYTVTIPQKVDFKVQDNGNENNLMYYYAADIKVTANGYIGDDMIGIKIDSANGCKLRNHNHYLDYNVLEDSYFEKYTVLFNQEDKSTYLNISGSAVDEGLECKYTLQGTSNVIYDGEYKDTLTFSYDLEESTMTTFEWDILENSFWAELKNNDGEFHSLFLTGHAKSADYDGPCTIRIYFTNFEDNKIDFTMWDENHNELMQHTYYHEDMFYCVNFEAFDLVVTDLVKGDFCY